MSIFTAMLSYNVNKQLYFRPYIVRKSPELDLIHWDHKTLLKFFIIGDGKMDIDNRYQ